MTPEEILQYCLENLEGTVRRESWGESGIFYNPGGVLKRGVYVLTVKEKDGANDRASRLDRPGVYRVSLGLRKETYVRRFGPLPARPCGRRPMSGASAPCPPGPPRAARPPWRRTSRPGTASSPTRFTPGWAGPPC